MYKADFDIHLPNGTIICIKLTLIVSNGLAERFHSSEFPYLLIYRPWGAGRLSCPAPGRKQCNELDLTATSRSFKVAELQANSRAQVRDFTALRRLIITPFNVHYTLPDNEAVMSGGWFVCLSTSSWIILTKHGWIPQNFSNNLM